MQDEAGEYLLEPVVSFPGAVKYVKNGFFPWKVRHLLPVRFLQRQLRPGVYRYLAYWPTKR